MADPITWSEDGVLLVDGTDYVVVGSDIRRADYDWARSNGRSPLEALAWAYGPRELPAARDDSLERQAYDRIWEALRPWQVEDTDGWGTWAVTLAWPGDRERAEGWGSTAEEARRQAATRLYRAGWRAGMSPELAALLLEEFEVIEAIEGADEIAALLEPPERGPDVRPVVDAHEVVDGMLVRDSFGDYLLRFGPWAHVAYAINVRETWRPWSLPLMHWPRRGRFEIVASGLSKETSAEELRAAAERFEAVAGKVTGWDPMAAVTSASEVRDA